MCKGLLSIYAMLIVAAYYAQAQMSVEVPPPASLVDVAYGVYGTGDVVKHFPNFSHIDSISSCCPNTSYPERDAPGIRVGIFYRRALVRSLVGEFRIGFREFGTTFVLKDADMALAAVEPDPTRDSIPKTATVKFMHTIDATLGSIDGEALIGYRPFGLFRLYAGLVVSLLVKKNIRYVEQIYDPPGVFYVDTSASKVRSKERNRFDGAIPYPSTFLFSLSLGAGYSFPLDRREHLFLEPQVFYRQGLTSIINQQEGSWHVNTLSFGVALRYTPLGIPPPPPLGVPIIDDDAPPLKPD